MVSTLSLCLPDEKLEGWREQKKDCALTFGLVCPTAEVCQIICSTYLDAVGRGHVIGCLLRVSVRTKSGYVALCHHSLLAKSR